MASKIHPRGPLLHHRSPGPVTLSAPMLLGLSSLLVLLGAMIALSTVLPTGPKAAAVFVPPYYIGTLANTLFLTFVPFLVAYYAGRVYRVSGIQAFLYLCSGMVLQASSAPTSAFMADLGWPSAAMAVYNLSMLCSSILHFMGCLTLYSGDSFLEKRQRAIRLVVTWTASAAFVFFLTLSALNDILPPFFVPGQGSTPLRDVVLDFSSLFFFISSVLAFLHYRATAEQSFFWYALGVALLATGILGVSYIRAPFDLINWIGRITQMLGSVYFLVAVSLAFKTSRRSHGGIDQAVREFYRSASIHFHDLVESASDAIVSFVGDRMAVWNPAAERLFGFSREEAAGLKVSSILEDDCSRDLLGRSADPEGPLTDRRTEGRARRKGGEEFPVEVSISRRELAGQTATTLIIRDITDRRRAEEALRESEKNLARAQSIAHLGSWTWDIERDALQWSDETYRILGLRPGGPAPDLNAFLQLVHPDDRETVSRALKEALNRVKPYNLEWRCLRPDGTVGYMHSQGEVEAVDGRPNRMIGTILDVTDRKRLEEALRLSHDILELRVQARTAELERKNQELQEFAFVASHDLSEPLRKIRTFGSLLREKVSDRLREVEKDYISRMTGAANRMQELLDALLRYSRIETRGQEFTAVDLNDTVRTVEADLEVSIKKIGARLEISPLPNISGDPTQWRQLFQNLLANALKYHRPGVQTVIKVHGEEENGTPLVCVEDNGIGFDEKYLDKIFQPFQRLHGRNEYPGTGIGLAICKKIVERHGGTITARSTPGKGSTFIVSLHVERTGR